MSPTGKPQSGFILWIVLVWFVVIAILQNYLMRTEQLSMLLLSELCAHKKQSSCYYQSNFTKRV